MIMMVNSVNNLKNIKLNNRRCNKAKLKMVVIINNLNLVQIKMAKKLIMYTLKL